MAGGTENVVVTVVGLLVVASLVALAVKKIRLPYSIALVVAGVLLGFLFDLDLSAVPLSELVFIVFVPPLLFEGAFNINFDYLRRTKNHILVLSLLGVVISSLVIGTLAYWTIFGPLFSSSVGAGKAYLYSLAFGSLITPTDPVSVLALFKEAGAPRELATIVEGESLFNDGTGVVIFTIILAIAEVVEAGGSGGGLALEVVRTGLVQFLYTVFIGGLFGVALGALTVMIMATVDDHLLELVLTICMVYGVYSFAHHFFHGGVIAVVVATLVLANWRAEESMSSTTLLQVHHFWEAIAFVVNSMLFILIGMALARLTANAELLGWALLGVVVVMVGRLVVYPSAWLGGLGKSGRKLPLSWIHILYWGGLRGSIPLALVLVLPEELPGTTQGAGITPFEVLLAITFGAVAFSLLVQGLTMTGLLRWLGLVATTTEREKEYQELMAEKIASRAAVAELDQIQRFGLLPNKVAAKLRASLASDEDAIGKELKKLYRDNRVLEDITSRTLIRVWNAQKVALLEAHRRGVLSLEALEKEIEEINELYHVKHEAAQGYILDHPWLEQE